MSHQIEKFINAILYFYENTNKNKLGVTKLMKLLFYADFLHYEKYGRPIIGDEYFRLPEGPVPTNSYDLFKETFFENKITELSDFVEVEDHIVRNFTMQRIKALKKSNMNVFSDSDIEILNKVANRFNNDTGTELADKTHKIPFVKEASHLEAIEYNNVMENKADKEYIHFLEEMDNEVRAASS